MTQEASRQLRATARNTGLSALISAAVMYAAAQFVIIPDLKASVLQTRKDLAEVKILAQENRHMITGDGNDGISTRLARIEERLKAVADRLDRRIVRPEDRP